MRLREFSMPGFRDPWADFECRATPPDVSACGDPLELGERYVYLLGIYLGDGTLAFARRNVWRLRVFQDQRYQSIVSEIESAMISIVGRPPGRTNIRGTSSRTSPARFGTSLRLRARSSAFGADPRMTET
jgi:hypothetical protein